MTKRLSRLLHESSFQSPEKRISDWRDPPLNFLHTSISPYLEVNEQSESSARDPECNPQNRMKMSDDKSR